MPPLLRNQNRQKFCENSKHKWRDPFTIPELSSPGSLHCTACVVVVLLCLQSWTRKQALTDEASILWDMHELCLLSCTLSAFPQVCFFHILCTRTFELKDWNCARISFSTKHWAKWQARQVYNLLVSIFYWIFICTSCVYCNLRTLSAFPQVCVFIYVLPRTY